MPVTWACEYTPVSTLKIFRLFWAILGLNCALSAQVSVTFARQPLETWKAAIGVKLTKVAVYDATACNLSQLPVTLPAGRVYQAAGTKMGTVSPLLISSTVARSQMKTKTAKTIEILAFVAWGISIAITADAIKIPENAKLALPLLSEALVHTGQILQSRVPQIERTAFLEGTLVLPVNSCESRLLLGEFKPDLMTFQVEIK
jgi:uncharacterized protein YacL